MKERSFSRHTLEYGELHSKYYIDGKKDVIFSTVSNIVGDKTLKQVIQDLENFLALLYELEEAGYKMVDVVFPEGDFLLVSPDLEPPPYIHVLGNRVFHSREPQMKENR